MQTQPFNESVARNPLRTKSDCERALIDILCPAMQLMMKGGRYGRFRMSDSGAVYSQDRTSTEGFCRLLWGLGPLFYNRENIRRFPDWWRMTCAGLVHGTTPDDPDYWGGNLDDYDQLFVEMGAVTAFLFETHGDFSDHLSGAQQQNMLDWLDQINHHEIPQTNWLWFRQMVNTWFVHTGHTDHEALVQADFDVTSSHYLGHGWSYDGYKNQIDNYIPFAYQFFTLLTIGLAERDDKKYAKDRDANKSNLGATQNIDNTSAEAKRYELLRQRASAFVPSYANWFASDGACLPFGRSLDYRFAQSAFWGAAAYAGIPLPTGWNLGDVKHLLLSNLRWWFSQNIFQSDGLIPIGYAYPNMNMAEEYNGPASAYWALKGFIFLCVPESDEFWTCKESEKLKFEALKLQPEPRMLITHSSTGREVQAFTAGQHAPEHNHTDAKYEKYVYSTTFGFSTPKAATVLKQMACDSILAISESQYHWRTAFGYEDYTVHDDYVYSRWLPWDDVEIRNFIVPLMPWHIRVHAIATKRALHLAEGGFSMPDDGDEFDRPNTMGAHNEIHGDRHAADGSFSDGWSDGDTTIETCRDQTFTDKKPKAHTFGSPFKSVFYHTNRDLTGLIGAQGFKVELAAPEPNTNLLYPKTRIPMQMKVIEPGDYVFVSAYLGDREFESLEPSGTITTPKTWLEGDELHIEYRGTNQAVHLREFKPCPTQQHWEN